MFNTYVQIVLHYIIEMKKAKLIVTWLSNLSFG